MHHMKKCKRTGFAEWKRLMASSLIFFYFSVSLLVHANNFVVRRRLRGTGHTLDADVRFVT